MQFPIVFLSFHGVNTFKKEILKQYIASHWINKECNEYFFPKQTGTKGGFVLQETTVHLLIVAKAIYV